MARYTPEFLAALKHRYERTDEPMRSLSREFKIGISTLSALVEKQGWQKRSQRTRNRLPTEHLLTEAQDLVASLPPRDAAALYRESPSRAARAEADEDEVLSPVDRMEAIVVKEIAAEESIRAELDATPRLRGEAERCARTISILSQTLQTLQKVREAQRKEAERCQHDENDDVPTDIEAFREALARRIDAFMRSREGEDFGEGDNVMPAATDAPDAPRA